MTEIKNFLPFYPNVNDPELIEKISRMEEFSEYTLPSTEPQERKNIKGIPRLHQQLQAHIASQNTDYSVFIDYHEMGTGKCVLPETLIFSNAGEYTIEELYKKFSNERNFSYTDRDGGIWSKPIYYSKDDIQIYSDKINCNRTKTNAEKNKLHIASYNNKTNLLQSQKIKHFYRQYIKEYIKYVELENGNSIRITKAHKLFNGKEWTNTFTEGDFVSISGKMLSSDFFESGPSKRFLPIILSKIINIKSEYYEGFVYDLEIDKYHNYVANNILCHNTCVISSIVEQVKNSIVNNERRKPALIILKNEALVESFITEISKNCTNNIYTGDFSKELEKNKIVSLSENSEKRRIKDEISKYYEIVTVQKFLNSDNIKSEEIIKRDYSDRYIFVDEAQNIRYQLSYKKKDNDINVDIDVDSEESSESESEDTTTTTTTTTKLPKKHRKYTRRERKNTYYDSLHRFLHIVENCRIFLLSGTPIWDKVYDIASLLNLVLPLSKQLPTLGSFTTEYFKDDELKPDKIPYLKSLFKGKISYLRADESSAIKKEIGIKHPFTNIIRVYPSIMSEIQKIISSAAGKNLKDDDKEESEAFYNKARDASNCFYPIFNKKNEIDYGVYGIEDFKKYIEVSSGRYKFNKEAARIKKFLGPQPGIDPLVNLRKCATKFATIIEMLLDPEKYNEKAFIFEDSVMGTGGVISLALILELYGFVWRQKVSDIKSTPQKITSFTPGDFVVITSDKLTIHKQKKINQTLYKFNEDDNPYGNRLRFIIGSEAIAFGYTMKAVRQVHIGMAHWNLPGTDQPIFRAYRDSSFDQLPEEERYINIYRHVAVEEYDDVENGVEDEDYIYINESEGNTKGKAVSTNITTDVKIYKMGENKEYRNAQIYRIMKESSWDCALNYKRNVLAKDVNYSRECNLKECNYLCDNYINYSKTTGPKFLYNEGHVWEYNTSTNDSTNYNILYSKPKINNYIKEIKNIFKNYFILHISMIFKLLGDEEEQNKFLIIKALQLMITHRVLILNRYGFPSYLREEKDVYFLDSLSNTVCSKYPNAYYCEYPLISEYTKLSDIVNIFQLEQDKEKIYEFVENPTDKIFNEISYAAKILILESCIKIKKSKENNKEILSEKEKHVIKFVLKNLFSEFYTMHDGNIVHNMHNSNSGDTKYSALTKNLKMNGLLRVYDIKNSIWDYVRKYKEAEYIDEIKNNIKSKLKINSVENPYMIEGSTDKFGIFKIKDDRSGKAYQGRDCSTLDKFTLWDISHHIKHLPYKDEIPDSIKDKSKKILLDLLLESEENDWKKTPYMAEVNNMKLDELRAFYTMLNMSREELCKSLKRWFKGENKDNKLYYKEF